MLHSNIMVAKRTKGKTKVDPEKQADPLPGKVDHHTTGRNHGKIFLEVTVLFLSILLTAALMAGAPNPSSPQVSQTAIVADQDKAAEKMPVVTVHKVVVKGKEMSYTATAGQLPMVNDAGENEAQIFFIAYTVNYPAPGNRRPLLFVFNGGPGASSVWLH